MVQNANASVKSLIQIKKVVLTSVHRIKDCIYFACIFKLIPFLRKELNNARVILDVGCGPSSPLRLAARNSYIVGLDYFTPYIKVSKKKAIHNDYVLADARYLPFRSKSFNCAIAMEVIEHMDKCGGIKMIEEMKGVAKKIILTTPNGFLPLYADPQSLNPEERHISGWVVSDFKKLRFKVFGLGGLRIFWRAEKGKLTLKPPKILSTYLYKLSEPFTYYLSSLAFRLLAKSD